jgi:hypothetical protein
MVFLAIHMSDKAHESDNNNNKCEYYKLQCVFSLLYIYIILYTNYLVPQICNRNTNRKHKKYARFI